MAEQTRICGRFKIGNNKGWCIQRGDTAVDVHYDDGSYTSFYLNTFAGWKPEPLGDDERAQLAAVTSGVRHD